MERDKIKKKIKSINRQLKMHGGNENVIKLRGLTDLHYEFLTELLHDKIQVFEKITQSELNIFFEEKNRKKGSYFSKSNIHSINIPSVFNANSNWELIIGTDTFGGPEVVFELKGWEVINQTFVD